MTNPDWANFGKPAFELTELLEASQYLARPEQIWTDADMERAHVELELMFLEGASRE